MFYRSQRRKAFWSLLCLSLVWNTMAHAEGGHDDTNRAAARTAGYEGIRAFEKGDMVVAVDKLGRAFGVVKVPTLGLWYARALVKTGKLVEGAERYGEVIRLAVTEGKVKEQKQAQAEAATELDALEPRIPSLTITLSGAGENCEVTLDGGTVPPKLLGLRAPVNPGAHRVQARQGDEVVEENVTLAEAETKAIELKLKPADKGVAPATRTNAGEATSSDAVLATSSKAPTSRGTRGTTQSTVGWITLGVGGVATVAGAITGYLAISKRGKLDDSEYCRGTTCTSEEHGLLTSYNQMRTLSMVGFIVGAVGIGTGTTLLLTAPKPKESGITAWVGVGSAGVRGSF